MIEQYALQRLNGSTILPELRQTLAAFVAEDAPHGIHLQWGGAIPLLFNALTDEDERIINPFVSAWSILAAFLERLDHLEDGDMEIVPEVSLTSAQSLGIHYNRAVGYLFLAIGILDELDPQSIPERRILRLRRFWSDCLLRAVSGQQCDLEAHVKPSDGNNLPGRAALDQYQRATQAKAGPIFALAFGGTAILATDKQETIDALSLAGEAFGTLLQYGDDVSDIDNPNESALTLPRAYSVARGIPGLPEGDELNRYWALIYSTYIQRVEQALVPLPLSTQHAVRTIFRQTFEAEKAVPVD